MSRVDVARIIPILSADMGCARQSLQERERVEDACGKVTCDETGIPRTQIKEMKSAEMSKSYRRVPANGTQVIEGAYAIKVSMSCDNEHARLLYPSNPRIPHGPSYASCDGITVY